MCIKQIFLLLLSIFCFNVYSQEEYQYVPETDSLVLNKLEQWQDLKFGLMMHWGTYSQWGIIESWSLCSEDEDWCKRNKQDYEEYKKEYTALKTTFNPTKFNPSKWAAAAKLAGMKYVVFTTKHHDGFCMFDSKETDYKITDPECPFHSNPSANITKEIFDAFREKGFMTGAYFSKPDWNSNYYWWKNFATPDRNVNYSIKKYPDRWKNFIRYTHNQINELMSDYGRIDILWLDGGWVKKTSDEEILQHLNEPGYNFLRIQNQDIDMPALVKNPRSKQPGLIVVDRAVTGPYQNYLTPENKVPDSTLLYPWETCMPMARSWSFVPDDKYKSPRELIHLLVNIVSKGGNFLLNIGPGPDGEWAPDAYDRLKRIGEWMKINGEAIYGTRPFHPYKENNLCFTQAKTGNFYAIYLAADKEDTLPETISFQVSDPSVITKVTLLGTDKQLDFHKTDGGDLEIKVSEAIRIKPPCNYAWAFKFE